LHTNSAAAASIPSWFEFIRNEESRNAGEKPVHGFMGSLSKRGFIQRLLTSSPTSITNGFAGVCSGMKSHCASAPVPPEPLKPVRPGVEQKATKETKKEIPGLGLLRFLL